METGPDHAGIFCFKEFDETRYELFILAISWTKQTCPKLECLKCLGTENIEQFVKKNSNLLHATRLARKWLKFICSHCEQEMEEETLRHYCSAFSPRPKSEAVKLFKNRSETNLEVIAINKLLCLGIPLVKINLIPSLTNSHNWRLKLQSCWCNRRF